MNERLAIRFTRFWFTVCGFYAIESFAKVDDPKAIEAMQLAHIEVLVAARKRDIIEHEIFLVMMGDVIG